MPSRSRQRFRPYRPSGLYRKALTPAQQEAKVSLRDRLIADRGGPEEITTAEEILVDLIAAAFVKHADAVSYLRTLPAPWVNRKSHASWPLVRDTTYLASHLAQLLDRLGYEPRAKTVRDIRQEAGLPD